MVRAVARHGLARMAAYACAMSLSGLAVHARPELPLAAVPGPQASLYFSIPAQALATALERYAVVSDQTVLFSDELVAHRRSSAVEGHFAPLEALELLLQGTRLRAERLRQGDEVSFVLRDAGDEALPPITRTSLDRDYDGLVQRRVWEALCTSKQTAPGGYRAVMLLEVDRSGRITSPHLLGTTGSAARDRAILATLHGLRLDTAPPVSLRQPLALMILPAVAPDAIHGTPGGAAGCPRPEAGDE